MSKLDEAKERITQLRYWVGVFLAAITALGTWLFNNIEASSWQIILTSCLLVISVIATVILNHEINKAIKQLGDL